MKLQSGAADGHDVRVAVRLDAQDGMALVAGGPGYVAQGFLAPQAHAQHLAGSHAFQLELGSYEGHGADLARDVDGLVRGGDHDAQLYRGARRV